MRVVLRKHDKTACVLCVYSFLDLSRSGGLTYDAHLESQKNYCRSIFMRNSWTMDADSGYTCYNKTLSSDNHWLMVKRTLVPLSKNEHWVIWFPQRINKWKKRVILIDCLLCLLLLTAFARDIVYLGVLMAVQDVPVFDWRQILSLINNDLILYPESNSWVRASLFYSWQQCTEIGGIAWKITT